MLKEADQEGRKQAQIDRIMALAKVAGQIQARASMPAPMEKQALSTAPVKAVAGRAVGAVRGLLGRGAKKAVTEGAEKAVAKEVGQVARPHWSPPPQVAGPAVTPGRMHPAIQPHQNVPSAKSSIMRRAEAEMQGPLQLASQAPVVPERVPSIVQRAESEMAQKPMLGHASAPTTQQHRQAIEHTIGALNPAQQAEITLQRSPGQLQLSHSTSAPVQQTSPMSYRRPIPPPVPAPTANVPGQLHPAIQPHQQVPAASAQPGLQTPAQAHAKPSIEAKDIAAEVASKDKKAPETTSGGQQTQAIEREAALKRARTEHQDLESRFKSDPSSLSPEEQKQLASHRSNTELRDYSRTMSNQEARNKAYQTLKWGGLLGAGGAAAVAYKAAPAVAGSLNQSSMYPMAGAYGWSPVEYGYGSNPYGPGALNLGPGA